MTAITFYYAKDIYLEKNRGIGYMDKNQTQKIIQTDRNIIKPKSTINQLIKRRSNFLLVHNRSQAS